MGKASKTFSHAKIEAIATRVAAETVVHRRAAPFTSPAFRGPVISHAAVEAVARISGVRVAFQAAMRSFGSSPPPAGVRMADDVWLRAQLDRRSVYKQHLAKLLGISSATANAWDGDGEVIHIVDR